MSRMTPPTPDVEHLLAEFARDLRAETTTAETIDVITASVVQLVAGVDLAGIALVHAKRTIETLGATDPVVEKADALQAELTEGPCLDAIERQVLVHAPDLDAEDRWPQWTPAVRRLGVRSVLAVQLYVHDRQVGSLAVYAREPHAFDSDDVAELDLWAAHAAVAVAASQKIDQLESAVVSRGDIGRAQGLVMERFDLDAEAAFGVLRRLSQAQNVRLVEVARELIRTRVLPGSG